MSLDEYARFYGVFAMGNGRLGARSRAWMMSAAGKEVSGGAHYALGTFVRQTTGGDANFWHWGRWRYSLDAGHDGPLQAHYSSFALRLGASDVNVAVYLEPALDRDSPAQIELDRALGAAVRAVGRWPSP